jgi:hypothetical protein
VVRAASSFNMVNEAMKTSRRPSDLVSVQFDLAQIGAWRTLALNRGDLAAANRLQGQMDELAEAQRQMTRACGERRPLHRG